MNRQPGQIISCPPAPSAPPTSVKASDVTSFNITVQWRAVDCIHRNGDITGYSVQYGVQQTEISGGTANELIITELESATTYKIRVAAVNSVGTGMYSDPIFVLTSSQ